MIDVAIVRWGLFGLWGSVNIVEYTRSPAVVLCTIFIVVLCSCTHCVSVTFPVESMPDTLSESSFPLSPSLSAFYYSVHGEIVEVNGLRGKLGEYTVYVVYIHAL